MLAAGIERITNLLGLRAQQKDSAIYSNLAQLDALANNPQFLGILNKRDPQPKIYFIFDNERPRFFGKKPDPRPTEIREIDGRWDSFDRFVHSPALPDLNQRRLLALLLLNTTIQPESAVFSGLVDTSRTFRHTVIIHGTQGELGIKLDFYQKKQTRIKGARSEIVKVGELEAAQVSSDLLKARFLPLAQDFEVRPKTLV